MRSRDLVVSWLSCKQAPRSPFPDCPIHWGIPTFTCTPSATGPCPFAPSLPRDRGKPQLAFVAWPSPSDLADRSRVVPERACMHACLHPGPNTSHLWRLLLCWPRASHWALSQGQGLPASRQKRRHSHRHKPTQKYFNTRDLATRTTQTGRYSTTRTLEAFLTSYFQLNSLNKNDIKCR